MNEKINAKSSMCWTCKFGICVKETENERIYHANARGLSEQSEEFDIFDGQSDVPGSQDDADLIEHTIEHERVKTICFWRPKGLDAPPILVANVKQCSRYETS